MEQSKRVALGRVVISQRERLVALEPRGEGMIATTIRSRDEVRNVAAAFSEISSVKVDKEMIGIAEKIMAQKEAPFDPETFVDRYEDALRDLIHEKQEGHEIVRAEEPEPASNVVDLMEALRASLKGDGKGARGGGKARASGASGARKPAAKKSGAKKRA